MAAPATSPVSVFFQKNKWVFPVGILVILLGIGGLIFKSMQPAQGSWRYGLCRTLLDFEFAYPPTVEVLSVAEERSAARLFVAEKNPFGNERIVQIDCEYQINGSRVQLSRLSLDRKPIPPIRMTLYNRMIPSILSQKMNVDLPKPTARSLDRLKR